MVATPDSPWGVNLKDYALTKAKLATCGIILLQCRIAICCLKNRDAAGDSPTNKGKDRSGRRGQLYGAQELRNTKRPPFVLRSNLSVRLEVSH